VAPPSASPSLEHPALYYADLDDFLGATVPFLTAGLEDSDVVFVAARGDYLPALGAVLAPVAPAAQLADTRAWHPSPTTRLRAFYEMITDGLAGGATGFRLVGEPVWPEGPPELVAEWQRYESALNTILAPFPVSLLCVYDAAGLDPSILAAARRTHPVILDAHAAAQSVDFVEPEEFLRAWNPRPDPPPAHAEAIENLDLAMARRLRKERAIAGGVPRERALDLCVAANEILTNARVHAGGATAMWTWIDDETFVCQIEDDGDGIPDPLAGYRPFSPDQSGRGLWLARQLVKILQITSESAGTSVRLQIERG
jgi:anti-sigma regulatory factor (Ser/Thr protein kinase)